MTILRAVVHGPVGHGWVVRRRVVHGRIVRGRVVHRRIVRGRVGHGPVNRRRVGGRLIRPVGAEGHRHGVDDVRGPDVGGAEGEVVVEPDGRPFVGHLRLTVDVQLGHVEHERRVTAVARQDAADAFLTEADATVDRVELDPLGQFRLFRA